MKKRISQYRALGALVLGSIGCGGNRTPINGADYSTRNTPYSIEKIVQEPEEEENEKITRRASLAKVEAPTAKILGEKYIPISIEGTKYIVPSNVPNTQLISPVDDKVFIKYYGSRREVNESQNSVTFSGKTYIIANIEKDGNEYKISNDPNGTQETIRILVPSWINKNGTKEYQRERVIEDLLEYKNGSREYSWFIFAPGKEHFYIDAEGNPQKPEAILMRNETDPAFNSGYLEFTGDICALVKAEKNKNGSIQPKKSQF